MKREPVIIWYSTLYQNPSGRALRGETRLSSLSFFRLEAEKDRRGQAEKNVGMADSFSAKQKAPFAYWQGVQYLYRFSIDV